MLVLQLTAGLAWQLNFEHMASLGCVTCSPAAAADASGVVDGLASPWTAGGSGSTL